MQFWRCTPSCLNYTQISYEFVFMRINIELDDELLQQVLASGHFNTNKAAIQAALSDYLNTAPVAL